MGSTRKRLLTGLQPSGNLTIGNYCGGILNIVSLQDEYDTFLFVPDLHSITVPQDPQILHDRIKEVVGLYLACGVDHEKCHIYLQSENLYHANLSWILECNSSYGEISRMHQFKEKSRNNENFSCGLMTYPVLMAADILLYDADYVPTGIDQKQHVELARNLAERFNKRYETNCFTMPEPMIPSVGGKIRDLVNPEKKMSKSTDNQKASIFLLDDPRSIKKKIMSAKTDNDATISFDEEKKPGISNLLTIYSMFSRTAMPQTLSHFEGAGYGDLKKEVVLLLVDALEEIQMRYHDIKADDVVDEVLDKGREYTSILGRKKYDTVRRIVGLGR